MASVSWEKEAAKCRAILESSIPKDYMLSSSEIPPKSRLNVLAIVTESGKLVSRELQITECDGNHFVPQMAVGVRTAEEVTVAYLKRATMGQQIEHVGIGGRICHTGYIALIKNVAPEDALAVNLLRNARAVILLRTKEPQSLMHGDTDNNITGPTLNPHNRELSTDGSSGGEGSCIAFKGSAIGVDTDIGGSIRIPSSFNGVYGFRPTTLRISYNGVYTIASGQEALRYVIGPLARSVEDLELFMRSILHQEPWDISTGLVLLPWAPAPDMSRMTVAVMHSNG